MDYKKILETSLKAARAIAQKAKDDGRVHLTDAEMKAFDAEMAKAEEAKAKLKEIEKSDELFRQLGALSDDRTRGTGDVKAGQVLSFKGLARQVKANMVDRGGFHIKALIATGSTVTTARTLTSPVTMAKPATGLLDLLPVRMLEDGDEYSYLTQTTRTNNAAPVAVGALKPTSVYTWTRVNRKLRVIAHVSEPIPQYWLKDAPALEQFVGSEMAYGLQLAVEDQALNGDGEGENLLGLLEASGVQTQTFNTSMIRTVRSAITKVEAMGYTASGIALNPLDWEAIETASVDEAHYALGDVVPVDRAARRLWGVPVAVTLAVTQGSGVLLSEAADGPAAGLVADPNLNLEWGVVGDDFQRNQVRARFEGRFGVEVYRPTGIVSIDLTEPEG